MELYKARFWPLGLMFDSPGLHKMQPFFNRMPFVNKNISLDEAKSKQSYYIFFGTASLKCLHSLRSRGDVPTRLTNVLPILNKVTVRTNLLKKQICNNNKGQFP